MRLTKDQEEKLCKDYQGGMGVPELSKKYKVANFASIKSILNRYRVFKVAAPAPEPEPAPSEKVGIGFMRELEVCAAHIFGAGCAQLTKDFGLSLKTVHEVLVRNEISIRAD